MTFTHRAALVLALAAAAAGAALTPLVGPLRAITIAAIANFAVYLTLSCVSFPRLAGADLKRAAARDDFPIWVIFLITLATAAASLLSLFVLINEPRHTALQVALALLSVPLGWATVHMLAAKHYAHLFWQPGRGQGQPRKGLEFPGTPEPGGWEFIYFAFIIGMTAQTADVNISGQHIRKFNVGHAIVSFIFNTVLVAAAVNVAVALAG